MRYFLIADDGQKYGPVDLATLNQWAAESRVLPQHQLEVETTAQRVLASTVVGLNFPSQTGYAAPNQGYYPRDQMMMGDGGASELKSAWIYGVLGLFCCPIFLSIMAIVYANKAKAKGNLNTVGPTVLGYIGLVLGVIGIISNLAMIGRR